MKLTYNLLIFIFVFIFCITLAQASVICSQSSISATFIQGNSVSSQTISCTNSNVTATVNLYKSGQYFSTSPALPITLAEGEANKQITINFESSASVGTYTESIYSSDGSLNIPVSITVQPQPSSNCIPTVFPLSLSNVKIQQGETKTRTIQLSVPSCYSNYINIQGISLATDEKPIQLGELSIGQISPGGSLTIPLELNSVGVQVGSYSDTLSFLIYNSTGSTISLLPVSISVLVTSGITPISNLSLNELPSCSLNSIELNLNNSYFFSCSRNNPNIAIEPIIDSDYLYGSSVSQSSSQYIYEFKTKNIGTTKFKALFKYLNAPIGTGYEQEVRISPSGSSPVSGIELKFNFYQGGISKNINNLNSGSTVILVVDNKTNSIVPSFKLYLNGVETNSTLDFQADKTYELRATSSGYVDLVQTINVTKSIITITPNPLMEFYEIGNEINFSTTPADASLSINNVPVTNPYKISSEGEIQIKAIKEGYNDGKINITVRRPISISAINLEFDKWAKGKDIVLTLTKNATWSIERDGTLITSGTNDTIKFTIEEEGVYTLKAGDYTLLTQTVEKSGWFSKLFSWIKMPKWYYIVGVIIVGSLIYLVFIRKTSDDIKEGTLMFAPKNASA